MYYSYLLKLSNNTLYSGFSEKLAQRINEHNAGNVTATHKYLPVQLVFYAAFINKKKALDFEKYLKSSSGFAFRNKRLV
ncbi:MAG: GIY-YIG nuclease family protein [Candidatus Amesbacteria bacterium]|nr:GIY-YIG nuclease family protein [Candidatus Amesbacteria bacterium]